MLTVDLHTHILPPPGLWPSLSERFGYPGWVSLESCGSASPGCERARMLVDGQLFREVHDNCWDPGVRVREMQEQRVDVQVLSTVPVMFSSWAKPQHTLDVSRWLNDHLAGACRAYPGRFVGLGMIPMNSPAMACRELERCVRELGMAGVQIGTNVNGINLGDRSLREVFVCAAELGACVFVHPWDMLGRVRTPAPLEDPHGRLELGGARSDWGRLSQHWAAWLVGMPAETTLAVCSVLMSGLLQQLPTLRLCFAHGGGALAGTIGRIEHGFHARPDLCQRDTSVSPRAHLRAQGPTGEPRPARFYVDSLVHDHRVLSLLLELMGAERIALGSDYPFPLGEDSPGALIRTLPGLSEADRARLLGETALEFLGPSFDRLRTPSANVANNQA